MNRARSWLFVCGALLAFAASMIAAERQPQQARPGDQRLEVLSVGGDPALGKVYLFAGTGANVVVQAGDEGAIVVDTSTEAVSELLLADVRKLTSKPIRYVINTSADSDHIGGNAKIAAAGLNFASPAPNLVGTGGPGFAGRGGLRPTGAQIYAHEAALNRL